jgi:putative Mg2+ transporter-C (MgtC) family protein
VNSCPHTRWSLSEISSDADSGVLLTLSGSQILHAPTAVAGVDGVTGVRRLDQKDE